MGPSEVIKFRASKGSGDLRRSCKYARVVDCKNLEEEEEDYKLWPVKKSDRS